MKKGSALLVVLGMLAFMLVSAVGFSAYMRYARLPSSFLRRSSASRLLAKAALAEAIDEIDAAIGNNPHPGFGKREPRSGAGSLAADLNGIDNEDLRTRNHWRNRVYIGTNQLYDVDRTVSTLTLEGLAYIPPALVNEARYYSRRSSAGAWKSLGFDSGRYAFCAIDVSDHFDVNALASSLARDSSAGGRISLAYLFEDANHKRYTGDPKTWDDFLVAAKAREISSAEAGLRGQKKTVSPAYVPFVSVADLNLAIHDQKPTGWESPFCMYIENGGSEFLNAVGVTDSTGPNADKVKRMSFVADGYFPATAYENAADADYDLASGDGQPFAKADLETEHPNLDGIRSIAQSTKTGKLLYDRLGRIGCAMLYDYLDDDNLPLSLAMPSVERTPMIAGIGLDGASGAIKIVKELEPVDADKLETSLNYPADYVVSGGGPKDKNRVIKVITYYKLDGAELTKFLSDGQVKSVLTYPFRRGVDLDDPTSALKFSLEGCLAFFFTYSNERFFHMNNDALAIMPEHFTEKKEPNGTGITVFRVPLKFGDFQNSSFGVVRSEADAVRDCSVSIGDSGMRQSIGEYIEKKENAVLRVEEHLTQEPIQDEDGNAISWTTKNREIQNGNDKLWSAFWALTEKGFEKIKIGSSELTPRVALWLRVKNGNSGYNTTDLVPAGVFEDDAFLGNQSYVDAADYLGRFPLMLFTASGSLKVSKESLDEIAQKPVDFTFGPNCLVCADPRFNWAPENWYTVSGQLTKNLWLDEAKKIAHEDSQGHDCDIFLATSDAGYMQSVYELAMLPRLTPLKNGGTSSECGDLRRIDGTMSDYATAAGNELNRDFMWTSYHPYDINGVNDAQAFRDLGIVSEGGGFKVSPFSDSTNVVVAAFANTPCDWWAAATNTVSRSGKIPHIAREDRLDAKGFNSAYALCEMNSDAKLEWADAEAVAQRFISEMALRRDDDTVDWYDVYDGLGWDDEDFCGVNGFQIGGEAPSDVDRKFLYGYWRDCFAVKQQLFLVFVRAEPMMTGGGALGRTPPQLGSRAVALVWRDPTASVGNNTPHRTRVLFYRQFD